MLNDKTQGTECPECGFLHPPVIGGCPVVMSKKTGVTVNNGLSLNSGVDQIFFSLKNIIESQIQQKQFKDINKLKNNLIIHTMNFFKNYDENEESEQGGG